MTCSASGCLDTIRDYMENAMRDKYEMSHSYECESCGASGIVYHDCYTIYFCPHCGEDIEPEEHYDDGESDEGYEYV